MRLRQVEITVIKLNFVIFFKITQFFSKLVKFSENKVEYFWSRGRWG